MMLSALAAGQLATAFWSRIVRPMDVEGYGQRPGQTPIERLLEDARTLSPAGIERVAAGWQEYGGTERYHQAEKSALHAIELGDRGEDWDELRNRLLGLTERHGALVSWRIEHGETGHRAEDALLGAALALTAQDRLDASEREELLRPMAEALPWLLTGSAAS